MSFLFIAYHLENKHIIIKRLGLNTNSVNNTKIFHSLNMHSLCLDCSWSKYHSEVNMAQILLGVGKISARTDWGLRFPSANA